MTSVQERAQEQIAGVQLSGRRAFVDALLVAVVAVAVSAAGSGRPSLWVDESATLSATTRSTGELWALVQHVDLVHGLYYLLLHAWFAVVPVTEFWARLPSALFVGAAAAGVVVLGRQWAGRSVGVAAGVVFAVLPRTTQMGIDARPYALTMACAVWVTVVLVVALRRGGGWWVSYAVLLAVSAVTNVVVLLVLCAHAVLIGRRVVAAWVTATAAALVAVAPFLAAVARQQDQVGWIWPVSGVTVGQIVGEQYFPSVYEDPVRAVGPDQQQFTAEQLSVAMQSWARVAPLIVVVVIIGACAVRRRGRAPSGSRTLVQVCAAWILAPTAILIGYSLMVRPVYQPQYLSFTTPAMALLIGLCVVVVGVTGRRIGVLLLAIGAAAAPNYVAQRGDYAKFGSDYSQVAELLAARGSSGDCLSVDGAASPSVAPALAGARVVHGDGLREGDSGDCAVVWTVTDDGADRVPPRYRPDGRWEFNQTQVVRLVRDG